MVPGRAQRERDREHVTVSREQSGDGDEQVNMCLSMSYMKFKHNTGSPPINIYHFLVIYYNSSYYTLLLSAASSDPVTDQLTITETMTVDVYHLR